MTVPLFISHCRSTQIRNQMAKLKRIMLVEDSQHDIELIMAALAANNFVNEVFVARDGAEALDFLYGRGQFAQQPNGDLVAVLLDLKLPKIDGLEVLEQIKADPALKFAPVLMLTSSREEQDLIRSHDLGVDAYVVKPVSFYDLVGAIKQIELFRDSINELPDSVS